MTNNRELHRVLRTMGQRHPAGGGNPLFTQSGRLDKISLAMQLAGQGKNWFETAKNYYEEKTTWSITISESDAAYAVVQQWLIDSLPRQRQRNVSAVTRTVYFDDKGNEETRTTIDDFESALTGNRSNRGSETRVALTLAETHTQDIVVNGHKVHVRVSPKPTPDEAQQRRAAPVKNGEIHFTCRSVEAQDAVLKMLNEMVGGKNKRKPSLWIADGWGNWRSQDAPIRKIESVILREGLKEDLIGDLSKFLDDEKKYVDLGIPYHRGYLFHGPAGTGKTSLIKALAAELGLDLWYAPLGDLKEDSSLVELISSVKSRGILLLEDVDSFAVAQDREGRDGKEEAGSGLSTSALLNSLDGVVTPHGLITIMTTNHLDKLDPALVRSGRADRTIELGYPTMAEIAGLWKMFFPDEPEWIERGTEVLGMSQSAVSEVCKRNWEDPTKAREELEDLIQVKDVK